MKNLILIISLFLAFFCNGQVPSVGGMQKPKIGSEEPGGCTGYGFLYNTYAIESSHQLFPDGWHWITLSEQSAIISAAGGTTVAGGHFKEVGYDWWTTNSSGQDNSTGWSWKGTGWINNSGEFIDYQGLVFMTNSKQTNASQQRGIYLRASSDAVTISNFTNKWYGVRAICVKNSTSLSNGETSTMISQSGKTYNTVCIGGYEVIVDNWEEDTYVNGTPITEHYPSNYGTYPAEDSYETFRETTDPGFVRLCQAIIDYLE